jgi:hypothetical protein
VWHFGFQKDSIKEGDYIMQLKYDKSIKNKIITITLETSNFSPVETKAIDDYGDPTVVFSKSYDGSFAVEISKKLKAGFKLTQKFDGTADLLKAITAADTFYEDIKLTLETSMTDVITLSQDKVYTEGNGLETITNF